MGKLLDTPADVEEYLQRQGDLNRLFPISGNVSIHEFSLGYVNKLFIIEIQEEKSFSYVLKQTWPYMRRVGSNWPLDKSRFNIELHCLLYYNNIVPNFSPKIYYYDNDAQVIIMEYLQGYVGLGEHLSSCLVLPNLAENVSTFLSHTLFFTSDYFLASKEKKQLQSQLVNPSIETISEMLVFTNPFMESIDNKWNPNLTRYIAQIRSSGQIKKEIAVLKEKFINSPQALLHGDLHQDSILSNSTDIKVIDPEFALWGPIGYDVGLIFCTLIIAYLCLFEERGKKRSQITKYQKYLLNAICEIWYSFSKKFIGLWTSNNSGHLTPNGYWQFPGGDKASVEYKNKYMLQVLVDACGFAGCRILAGLMGFITFHNIKSINDKDLRTEVEKLALRIGQRLILERNYVKKIENLISIIKTETTY